MDADTPNKNVDDDDAKVTAEEKRWRDVLDDVLDGVLDGVLDDTWYLEEVVGRKRWGAHGVKYPDGVANYVLPVIHVDLGIGTDINSYIEEGVDGVLGASKHDDEGCK